MEIKNLNILTSNVGDLCLPGIILSFLFKFDFYRTQDHNSIVPLFSPIVLTFTYFINALLFYLLGLIITMVFAFGFDVAQPALLYLAPAVIISIFYTAFKRNELSSLWKMQLPENESTETSEVNAKLM